MIRQTTEWEKYLQKRHVLRTIILNVQRNLKAEQGENKQLD